MRRGDVEQNLVSLDATATGVAGEGLSIGFGTAGKRALDSARSPTGCWGALGHEARRGLGGLAAKGSSQTGRGRR